MSTGRSLFEPINICFKVGSLVETVAIAIIASREVEEKTHSWHFMASSCHL